MPTPDFIKQLRSAIGHELLWLPGVTGVVRNHGGEILLVRSAHTDLWTLVAGCLEPGEEPAAGMVREIFEETGVTAVAERILSVRATKPNQYPNGDAVQFLDVAFLCRATAGDARLNDDESTEVSWFAPDRLPRLSARQSHIIALALSDDSSAWFAGQDGRDLGDIVACGQDQATIFP